MKNLFFMAIVLLVPSITLAGVQDLKEIVQAIFAKAGESAIVSDLAKQEEINKQVDFTELARSALGRENGKITTKDFDWFRDTLREIIILTVYPNAPEFLKGVKISYDKVTEKDGFAEVSSTVQNKADLTEVSYSLAKKNDGSWKVVDITLSGNRWTEIIHEEVMDVLKKKKWKGLKEAMDKRLLDLRKQKT